jgi:hypothetical protein
MYPTSAYKTVRTATAAIGITTHAFSNVLNTLFPTTFTLLMMVMQGARGGAVG